MEEVLEAVILGGGDDEEIEWVVLNNILIDRDEVDGAAGGNFDINNYSDEDAKLHFRFSRHDILRLLRCLNLPNEIQTDSRNKVNSLTALCILLKRLTYPNRLFDICTMFGYSPQSLSQIIQYTINLIIEGHERLLSNLDNLQWLDRNKLQNYAAAVQNKGAAVPNCWAFIDGTARQICRPTIMQENYYSGHKRFHCVKYQSVLCPDGIIVSLKGAFPGRRHDAGIFRESNLYQELEQKAVFNENEKYIIYGDQAYGIMELLLSPYHGRPEDLPPHHQEFNRAMKVLRVAVEWGFQKIVTEFAFVDFRKNQKLLLQDVQAMYKVAVLFTNCHTCLYGSQTAMYFNIIPPTLEEYFGIENQNL